MPKNWKYIKKLLEKEFLCEKLRGHITYDLADYKPNPWYQQHFIMKYDDEVLLDVRQPSIYKDKRYDHYDGIWYDKYRLRDRVLQTFRIKDCVVAGYPIDEIILYAAEQAEKSRYHDRGIYGVEDIMDFVGIYLHSSIDESLDYCHDSFVLALGLLDRRCGKRRLKKFTRWCSWSTPDWLRRIYVIRFEAEGIEYHEDYKKKKGEN